MTCFKPRIAISTGDCAGIGPELVLRALNSPDLKATADLIVYGSRSVLQRVSTACGIPFPSDMHVVQSLQETPASLNGPLLVNIDSQALQSIKPGVVQAACGLAAANWITTAAKDVIEHRADALVTAPINKESFNKAGISFSGHTEMLAALCGVTDPCMAFFTPGLIVALATIHIAIADVPAALNRDRLVAIAKLIQRTCIDQGIKQPKLGILALNPHAGEGGLFGDEELHIIQPAIDDIRRAGININGPLVPDTAFKWLSSRMPQSPFDAYIAMYHDQALIPFKIAAFDKGVNVTLGLPIIRTSPDHGTAFNLAWQGKASPNSFFEAIHLALKMSSTN